jgi:hypothetical protein
MVVIYQLILSFFKIYKTVEFDTINGLMTKYLTKTSTAHVLLKFSSWQRIQWLCLFVNHHHILSIKLQATFSSNSTIEQHGAW